MDIDQDKIKELREKPSLFVSEVLDIDPYPYQKEFMDVDADRKTFVAGRQVGKTTVLAWECIHQFTMYPDRNILITAPTQRQVYRFLDALKSEISEWLDNPNQYGIHYSSKSEIHGKNGSKIIGLPAAGEGETIRGYTIDTAIVDEAAFVDDNIMTSIVAPMLLTTDGKFILASTAWGQSGYLYEKFENDDNWYSMRVTSMENPDIAQEHIEEFRRDMSPMEFEREILAQFSDKESAFFQNKDLNGCLEWTAGEDQHVVFPGQTSRSVFMGVDPASQGDDSAVFTTVDEDGNVFEIVSLEECSIPEIEGQIRNLIRKDGRNYLQVLVEENGIGEGAVDHLEDEFRCVEGFRTTIRSKESIYNEAKSRMQEQNLKIPDHTVLKEQLRSIEYEMTSRGNMKIHAPEGKHDDFADSFVLSIAALTGKRNHVDRMTRAYSFDNKSRVPKEHKNKRAFTFGG